jgi:hypothetical protein
MMVFGDSISGMWVLRGRRAGRVNEERIPLSGVLCAAPRALRKYMQEKADAL